MRPRLSSGLLLLATLTYAPVVLAAEAQSLDGTINIEDTWAKLAPKESDTASVFFELMNVGDKPDTLISASSPAAKKVTVRRGKWLGLNFFNRTTDAVQVKGNHRLSFHPGAMEVTLSEFTQPVDVRSVLPVTLVFQNAGPVQIEAEVSNQLLGNRIKK